LIKNKKQFVLDKLICTLCIPDVPTYGYSMKENISFNQCCSSVIMYIFCYCIENIFSPLFYKRSNSNVAYVPFIDLKLYIVCTLNMYFIFKVQVVFEISQRKQCDHVAAFKVNPL